MNEWGCITFEPHYTTRMKQRIKKNEHSNIHRHTGNKRRKCDRQKEYESLKQGTSLSDEVSNSIVRNSAHYAYGCWQAKIKPFQRMILASPHAFNILWPHFSVICLAYSFWCVWDVKNIEQERELEHFFCRNQLTAKLFDVMRKWMRCSP